MFIRLVLRLPNPVELFKADQRVFVGGVLMIKLMLHEAGEPAEFRNVFAEQIHLMHGAQHRRDAAAAFENGQKRLAHALVVQKITVHQRKLVPDELREVGMQLQPVLLRVEEHAHQTARLVAENAAGRSADFAVPEQKTIHRLHRAAPFGQPGAQRGQPVLRRREQGHALFQRARDEKNVPHVRVEVAHEFFDAHARRPLAVAEAERNGGLQIFAQRVERAVDVVVQFRPYAQQKVVGGFKLFALGFGDELAFLQFLQRARAILEKRHPQHILEIAQAAAAVFDVRFLHAGRVAELAVTPRLVFEPRGNVFSLITVHTPGHERLFKFFEQHLAARNQPRLDERGFRLHVGVGDVDAIVNAPHRVADLQAGVPQRIQHSVNQLGQMRQRFARRDLAVVQKHEVNVAVRVQFRAAVTADGDERERRKLLLRLRRQTASRRPPKDAATARQGSPRAPGRFRARPRRRDAAV